jgi:aldehyde:ferredoxin oxidoreductase
MLGANCLVRDPQAIIHANVICNEGGIDTISAGATVGMALTAADAGRLSWKVLDLHPDMERGEMVVALLERIVKREGIGDLLAEGVRTAGHALGIADLAPEVKGLEFSAYEPRVSPGMSLAFMTSDRGACHQRSSPVGREVSGVLPWFMLEGKPEFVKRQQDEKAAEECLGVCQFPYGIGLLGDALTRLLSTASGESWSYERLCTVGERIWNLSRAFNAGAGIDRSDDYLPLRFSEEPLPDGMNAGRVISREDQDWMLDRYYEVRGWTERGIPTPEVWRRLGLEKLVGTTPHQEVDEELTLEADGDSAWKADGEEV